MAGKGTTGRKVRVDDDLWLDSGAAAAAFGTDTSAVMRDALAALVEAHRSGVVGDIVAPRGVEVVVRVDLVPVEATA